ncbi:hypothetical protein [Marisediminitalea sp.]|uniref:hypothetical protein n=1 Tax=Marisediminitalea sp. TaxID=2662268 RepID=UPI00351140A5
MIQNEKINAIFGGSKKQEDRFQMISPLRSNKHTNQDIFDALATVRPAAIVLFNEIKLHRNVLNNVCFYEKRESLLDPKGSPYQLFRRYVKELKQADIIKEIPAKLKRKLGLNKDGYYFIINPSFIYCKEKQQAREIWKAI